MKKYDVIVKVENIEAENEEDALNEISDLLLKMKDNKYAGNTIMEVYPKDGID